MKGQTMATRKKSSTVPAGYVSANVQAEFWKPENAGDTISGHYQGSELRDARDNFKEQLVFVIADENGELHILTGASLTRQFERVNEGDHVIVEYHGRKAMKNGKAAMKDYTVNVKGEIKPFKRND